MAQCDAHDPSYVCPGKREWPELVGKKAAEAEAVIRSENPLVNDVIIKVYPDVAPPDFCCNRVYIWVDCLPDGNVLFAPMIA